MHLLKDFNKCKISTKNKWLQVYKVTSFRIYKHFQNEDTMHIIMIWAKYYSLLENKV